MAAFPQFTRPPQKLAASGIVGAASPDEWRALHAVPVAWDELFASTGLFGVEIGPAAALSGTVVQLNGFMTPPATADADYFVLYPAQARTRKFFGSMMRKLSVTSSQ